VPPLSRLPLVFQGVANRDLKLENLLLCSNGADASRPLLKIADFGAGVGRAGGARPRQHTAREAQQLAVDLPPLPLHTHLLLHSLTPTRLLQARLQLKRAHALRH
jgi:serine/threonine protein kinase